MPWDVAQICENGHVINSMSLCYPDSNENFCSQCGQKTITQCPSCGLNIRGEFYDPADPSAVLYNADFLSPGYCTGCGSPYPWTTSRLDAAKENVDLLVSLSSDDKELLKSTLPDLVVEGPRTSAATERFKAIMAKTGKDSLEIMRRVLVDVISETVYKAIFRP